MQYGRHSPGVACRLASRERNAAVQRLRFVCVCLLDIEFVPRDQLMPTKAVATKSSQMSTNNESFLIKQMLIRLILNWRPRPFLNCGGLEGGCYLHVRGRSKTVSLYEVNPYFMPRLSH